MDERGNVLVRVDGGQWGPPTTTGYGSESEMQLLLAAQPELLPGVAQGSKAVTEFATRVGPSDVVVVGSDGEVTIVECKLASNEEARRKIVGQVLDYAARTWKMPITEFEARWMQRSGEAFDSWLMPDGLAHLETNLSDGRFRLVLAVDRISADLRRLVEFLNAHTLESVQVLAIELSIARAGGGVEVLIPTVYGMELAEAAGRAQSGRTPNWTVQDVTDWFTSHRPDIAAAVQLFLEMLGAAGCLAIGTSAQSPSLGVAIDGPAGRVWPYSLYSGAPKPSLNLNFEYVAKCGQQAQEQFLSTIHRALPDQVRADQVRADGYRRRPGIDPGVLARPGVIELLVDAAARLGQVPAPDALVTPEWRSSL